MRINVAPSASWRRAPRGPRRAGHRPGQAVHHRLRHGLTGGLAPNGKAALLAMQIWEEEINAKGGLLGRPVKLVYYDDQSNPSTVPGIYTKLMDVDKVDIIASELRDQHDRAGDADRHAARPDVLLRCSASR